MRLALRGHCETIVALDYGGQAVLAAYEPIGVYGLGLVAKIDLAEIRAPFIRAAGPTCRLTARCEPGWIGCCRRRNGQEGWWRRS